MSNEYKSELGITQGSWLKGPIFYIIAALIVAVGGFGVGRLTKISDNREPIQIQAGTALRSAEAVASVGNSVPEPTVIGDTKQEITPTTVGSQSGQFVASKNGKKYFPTDCASAKSIKAGNKVFFKTQDEAKKAGYEPSSMCKF